MSSDPCQFFHEEIVFRKKKKKYSLKIRVTGLGILERSDEHLPMKFESLGGEKFADEYDEDGGEKLKKKLQFIILCFLSFSFFGFL